jgi:phage repressor protein C with HTH and peptisase S24 domain/DNA-binding Xre family transcriptional regulator
MQDLILKLKAAREEKGLTQIELAEKSGVSIQSIKRYETKCENLTVGTLRKIADALNVDISYFFDTGLKKMSLNQSHNLSLNTQNIVPNVSLNLPNVFKNITTDSFSAQNYDENALDLPNTIMVPVYDEIMASAGSGRYNDDETAKYMPIKRAFLRDFFNITNFINISIISVTGDSMQPSIPEKCYLLVCKMDVRDGQICVARVEGELYVKRLQKRPRLRLLSDNKSYEPININEGMDFAIIGVVAGVLKSII